jgi:predicted transcriptional regulator
VARLGELERKVMELLWSSPGEPLTVREVAVELPHHAYTTVLTVLDRLARKGMVERTKDGRAHRYSATAPRDVYTAELMREALRGAPDSHAVLVKFAETVTASEAEVLRSALGGLLEPPTEKKPGSPKTAG